MTAFAVGFVIAMIIGLAGFGGGTVGTPLLILVLRMKGAVAVGTALAFAAIVQLIVAPTYILRRNVDYRTLGWMLIGGFPGVLIGGSALILMARSVNQKLLILILGIIVVIAAVTNIIRMVRDLPGKDRPQWLAALMFPVGLETGFSSAGAGAFGMLGLLGFTRLEGAKVVGTGICFGCAVSSTAAVIQVVAGNFDFAILELLLAGGVIGGFIGSFLAHRLPSRILKYGLAVFLVALGLQLVSRGLAS